MAGEFFGRNLEFSIETRSLPQGRLSVGQAGPTRSLASFFENKIDVSLAKDVSHDSANTGSVTVTNIDIDQARAFISLSDPLLTTYTLRAGYGGVRQELPVLSRGYITQTDWNHQGGDSSITFSITEGSKLSKNLLRRQTQGLGKKPLSGLISRLRELGQEIEFVPDEQGFTADTEATQKGGSSLTPKKPIKELLTNLLGVSLYDWFVDSGKIVIYKRSAPAGSPLVNYRTDKLVTIGFDSGLLSADAETTVDSEFGFWIPWLSFRCLYIPEILPLNVVEIREPLYPHLNGKYKIMDCGYSLTNKASGDFAISARALPLDYRDISDQSVLQLQRRAEETERRRRQRLDNR